MTATWRNFDPILMVAALALTGYGALLIYSAALPRGSTGVVLTEPVVRHIVVALAGTAITVAAARIDYRLADTLGWFAYGVGVLLLIAVLFLGLTGWIAPLVDLGFTLIQALEIAKLLTIVGLAKFMTDYRERMQEWSILLLSLGLAAVPALLVFVEPDFGSAFMFAVIWAFMAIFAGARPQHFLVLGALLVFLIPFGLVAGVSDYQRDRIRIFIDPLEDPLGDGFNVLQAETSVGSGGLWGKGLTQGTQTQLDFLQTQTTDFIFSVLGEELGFIGAMSLFALFMLFLGRGLRAILRAPDSLGQLLAVGIVTMVAVQAFINVGVNIRLVPVTGIPLPFISVGNSSLLVLFVALGIMQSVVMRQDEGLR